MSGRTVVTAPTWTATMIQRDHDDWKHYYTKTRVYDAPKAFAPEAYQRYVDALNDPKIGDNAEQWLKRDMIKQTRAALRAALPQLLPHVSVNYVDRVENYQTPSERSLSLMRYSDKAGCSCGCSPGFILDDSLRDTHGVAVDLWFMARSPELANITPEMRREAVAISAAEVNLIMIELSV